MTDFIPVPWGNSYLMLSRAEFDAALARGLAPAPQPIGPDAGPPVAGQGLLTSAQLGERLSVTAEFAEEQARKGAWPSYRIGRYLRFDLSEVRAAIANGQPK